MSSNSSALLGFGHFDVVGVGMGLRGSEHLTARNSRRLRGDVSDHLAAGSWAT